MAIRVLLVNSHQIVLWGLEKLINAESPDMEVVGKATNGHDAAHEAREKKPDILLLDLCLAGEKCSPLISDLLSEGPFHIIIFTEFHDQATIDEAVLKGSARGSLQRRASASNHQSNREGPRWRTVAWSKRYRTPFYQLYSPGTNAS